MPILKEDEYNPTFKEIEEAFNIETVTKEFFNRYTELFFQLKENLDALLEKDERIKKDFKELKYFREHDILNNPSRFADTYWGSAIYRQEQIMTIADSVQHMNEAYKNDIINVSNDFNLELLSNHYSTDYSPPKNLRSNKEWS